MYLRFQFHTGTVPHRPNAVYSFNFSPVALVMVFSQEWFLSLYHVEDNNIYLLFLWEWIVSMQMSKKITTKNPRTMSINTRKTHYLSCFKVGNIIVVENTLPSLVQTLLNIKTTNYFSVLVMFFFNFRLTCIRVVEKE